MAFVDLEDGDWVNAALIKTIQDNGSNWFICFSDSTRDITDADRVRILKTAGFVKIKKEKNDE